MVPLLLAIVLNAVTLLPELSIPIPNLNDDSFHFMCVQRADAALAGGENPFDHWEPTLEMGFPDFFYYQHVPHLAVVALHRLVFNKVSLLTLFNLVRYLLMVLFPLTVWWSMRTMGFTHVAATMGAAFAPLLDAGGLYGFDFHSYVWRGFGMYTQLWAMNFIFIATASVYRVLRGGDGYTTAILSCAMVVLSDLMYAYMLGIVVAILFVFSLWREEPA